MANLAIAANDVKPSSEAVIVYGNAVVGTQITAGRVVFLSSGFWLPAIAEFGTPVGIQINDVVGIACNAAYDGQPLAVCLEDPAFQLGDPNAITPLLTQGETYILSGAGGSGFIAPLSDIQPDWYRVVLGQAINGGLLKFERIATGQTA